MDRTLERPEEMIAAGRELAAELQSGAVLALVGELGAGKTQFVRGILAGLGASDEVSSPTFTLLHEYGTGPLPVFHFDFYRLETPAELVDIGWDDYLERGGVVIVEWADKFPALLPASAQWFEIRHLGGDRRHLRHLRQLRS